MTKKTKVHVDNVVERAPIWCIGWLLTIGYAQLGFWEAVYAILLWPYDLGVALRG